MTGVGTSVVEIFCRNHKLQRGQYSNRIHVKNISLSIGHLENHINSKNSNI